MKRGGYKERYVSKTGAVLCIVALLISAAIATTGVSVREKMVANPPVTILSEDFESQWVEDSDGDPAPEGWEVDVTNPLDGRHWSQFDNELFPLSHSGDYCAGVWWSQDEQNERLYVQLNLQSYVDVELEFYSIYYWDTTFNDFRNTIEVSLDGGNNWTVVASLLQDTEWELGLGGPGGPGWNWNEEPIQIDLSQYAGEPSVILSWHYWSENPGEGGKAIWMIDDVTITGVEDTNPPTVNITKPDNAIYLNDNRLIPFLMPIVIGSITIEVDATDAEGSVSYVEFYVDDVLKSTDTSAPYTWLWNETAFLKHTVKAVAYDTAGNNAYVELSVWKFF